MNYLKLYFNEIYKLHPIFIERAHSLFLKYLLYLQIVISYIRKNENFNGIHHPRSRKSGDQSDRL